MSGVAFTQNTRDEVRFINGDGSIAGALGAEPGTKQQNYIAIQDTTTRQKQQNGRGWNDDGASYTLDAAATQGVAIPINGMTLNKELRDKQMTGVGNDGDPMFSVRANGAQHAIGFYANQGSLGQGKNQELSPTIKAAESTNHAAVAYNFCGGSKRDFHVRQTEVAACVTTKSQEPGETTQNSITAVNQPRAVAYGLDEEQNGSEELFGTLKARVKSGGFQGAVAFGGDIARTLQARHDSSPCADRGQDVVAVDCYNQTISDVAIPIRSKASDIEHTGGVLVPTDAVAFQPGNLIRRAGSDPSNQSFPTLGATMQGDQAPHVAQSMAVRRLTPCECERLQGFSDDHTLIPWRGKPADQCPDGPRYKALGNSMAVPCMAWIGRRIAAQEMFPLRYLSVCSGIEAASVAWEPLGWQPAAFSEVEKFPSAVLAHHWPDVPNLGDMTQYEQWKELGAIDLLVGGTPCQSFSVAGLRQGLRDPRGGLMLTYLEIARSFGPRWLVWENVPGVLSSHGGRDFGAFLGALGALGYGFAYRVLDAQWFGVAQRRRRVFVVGHLGDWTAAAKVLFERESVRRNPAPSREKGQGAAADARAGVEASGGSEPVGALDCRIGAQRAQNAQAGHYIAATAEGCDLFNHAVTGSVAHSIRVGNGNAMGGVPSVVGALSDGAHNGGGLNGQDAYSGRIFACSKPNP
jgi:site-specific DNA-cytosine methylase